MTIGFIGLGTMGQPMAQRLLGAGVPLWVWNRTPARAQALVPHGATAAPSVDAVFAHCDIVLLMLLDDAALDATLQRGSPGFAARVAGRMLVQLGTTSAAYSRSLHDEVVTHGGRYVEAPVSGSRAPAERGELIGMLAGSEEDVARVESLLAPFCREVVHCGRVPHALRLKLAVNHYLIATVAALAEATTVARALDIDLSLFRRVLDAGPMASVVSRAKLAKLVETDFSPQAAIRDVAQIAALVAQQARSSRTPAPLIALCEELYTAARDRGLAGLDMAAVFQPGGEQR